MKFPLGIILAVSAALGGCSSRTVTRDVPVVVSRPVPQPCVTGWPQKPPPLPDGSHWAGYDIKQKAAALGAYAINMTNYAEALNAATAGCKEIRP